MQQTLININKCIQAISSQTRQNELGKDIKKMEALVNRLPKQYQNPYLYFLSQVLAIRMGKFQQASEILQSINNRQSKQVYVNSYIRKAYFLFLQSRYSLAYISIQQAIKVAKTDAKLFQIASMFCSRIVNATKKKIHETIMASIGAEIADNFRQALKLQIDLFKTLKKDDTMQTQSKKQLIYFTAKRLIELNMGQVNVQYSGVIKQAINLKDEFEQKHQNLSYQYTSRLDFLTQMYKLSKGRVKGADNQYDVRQLERIAKIKLNKIIEEAQRKDHHLKGELQNIYQAIQFKVITQDQRREKTVLLKKFLKQQLARKDQSQDGTSSKVPIRHVESQSGYESPQKRQKKFNGSYMIKIHATSDGQQKRFFYLKDDQFKKERYRLYYKDKEKSSNDSEKYYSLKGLIKIQEGKASDQLKRKSCQNHQEDQCFSLYFQKEVKSFYVPNKEDYVNWMELLKQFRSNLGLSKMMQSQPGFVDSIVKTTLKKTKIAM